MASSGNVTVRVDGLQELGARLKALSADMQKKAAWQATGRGAGIVKKAAKTIIHANADKYPTGTLEGAVIAKRVPAGQRRYTAEHWVTVRRRKTGKKSKGTGKQQTAPHAGFVEFGTVRMQAEPYLRPALQRNLQRIGEAMRDKLAKAIAKFEKK